MVCKRLANFDDFCKVKCAEREAARASKPYSLWERILNLGVDCRIDGRSPQQPYNWLDDKDYYSHYVMPYREQYKRLNELEVWLAHCVQEDTRVQISPSDAALLLGGVEMNFELWAWGDGINADFSDRVVVKGWDVEPSRSEINMEAGWFLCILEFDAVQQVSSGKPYYDVLKDGGWGRVYFLLREN